MQTVTDERDSTRVERTVGWMIGWRVFLANPILGVGAGNINWHMAEYEDSDPNKKSLGGRATHSLYFILIPEMGLFGIALSIWLLQIHFKSIASTIRLSSNATDPLKDRLEYVDACARAPLFATGAYLISGIHLSVLYYPHLYYLVAMSFAIERTAKLESALFNAPPAVAPTRAGTTAAAP